MRLINTETLELEDSASLPRVEYAILSHTWGAEEITFSDMQSTPNTDKTGWRWRKILDSCKQAQIDRHSHIWCDTCCIDKSSSAELSESINSMFRWYHEAKVCYAFLEDVQDVEDLAGAKWFTRGWTLQELIAPKSLVFYNSAWQDIGTREKLAHKIEETTGIDHSFLRGASSMSEIRGASFAKRVSWAAKRDTKRGEDIAYCLMGLLDVNMPLLYGEGDVKAFRRLQEEFLKVNVDQSFLAWLRRPKDGRSSTSDGSFLAGHPRDFHECGRISVADADVAAFALTNKGLQIGLPLLKCVGYQRSPDYFAILACHPDGQPDYRIRISLRAVERTARSFAFEPGDEQQAVPAAEINATRLTDCCILRITQTPWILSISSLPMSLLRWKPKIVHLNTSTWTWDCLSEPKDPKIPPIRVPDQREKASYGVLFHPPSSCPDITSSDHENTPCLKVLVRLDVGFDVRYGVDVGIQLFHVSRNEAPTDSDAFPSIPSADIPSNSRSRVVSIPAQLSETIHASALWKRIRSRDELLLKIDLAPVDVHRAYGPYASSISAFKTLLSQDPLVHCICATIPMVVLFKLRQPDAISFEALQYGLSVLLVYFIALQKERFMGYIRPEYRLVYYRLPFVLAFLLLSKKDFVGYNDVPYARYYGALHWALAGFSAFRVLETFMGRMGYESRHEEQIYAQESDSSTGLQSLLLDDTIR